MSYTLAYTGTQIDNILGRSAPNGEFDGYFADINDKLDKLNIVTTSDDYATVQAYVQNNVAVALSDGGKFYVYTGEYDGNYYFACVTQGSSDTTDAVFEVAYIDSGNNWSVGGWSALAPVFSPNFTGNPTAPTPTQSSNNTKIATTAFVHTAVDPVSSAALNAYPTDTVSGDVVSITDGADSIPVKAFTGSIIPQQNLNGQSAPYPAGGNKNKFDADTAYSALKTATNTYVGTGTQFNGINVNVPDSLIGVECTFSAYLSPASGASNVRVVAKVDGTDVRGDSIQGGASGYSAVTFTPTAGTTLRISYGSGGSLSITVKDLQLETGASRTAWVPYSNICPISGWTGANITRAGKNLFNPHPNHNVSAQGEYIAAGAQYWATDYIPIGNTKSVVVSVADLGGMTDGSIVRVAYASDGTVTSTNIGYFDHYSTPWTFTLADNVVGLRFRGYRQGGASPITGAKIQVEFGSSASTYEAYQGETILLSFGQTVYAGTLTALGGGLWQVQPTHAIVDLGSLTWVTSGLVRFKSESLASVIAPPATQSDTIDAYCSMFKVAPYGTLAENEIGVGTTGNTFIGYKQNTSVADFVAAITGQKFCYPLATLPDPITITGEDLQTLLGANTVWTDVGSVTGMTYRADTALYIQKLIGGGGTLSTLSMASPSPSLSLGRVGVLAEPEEAEPEQTDEETEQTEQTEQLEQTEEAEEE